SALLRFAAIDFPGSAGHVHQHSVYAFSLGFEAGPINAVLVNIPFHGGVKGSALRVDQVHPDRSAVIWLIVDVAYGGNDVDTITGVVELSVEIDTDAFQRRHR